MQRVKLAIGLIAIVPLVAQLQSRPPVLELSLKQAVEMALAPEGSTRVKLAEEALKEAEARRLEARAALLPDLEGYIQDQSETNNLKAFGFRFNTFAIPGFSIPTFVGPFNVFDVRATVNQNVFDFSSIRRYRAAKVAVQAVKADNEGTRDQVTDQVARAYLAGLRAEASLETARRGTGSCLPRKGESRLSRRATPRIQRRLTPTAAVGCASATRGPIFVTFMHRTKCWHRS